MLGIMENSTIIIAREWSGIIPTMPYHYLGIMEPKFDLPCYNVKNTPLTSETEDAAPPLGPHSGLRSRSRFGAGSAYYALADTTIK